MFSTLDDGSSITFTENDIKKLANNGIRTARVGKLSAEIALYLRRPCGSSPTPIVALAFWVMLIFQV